MTIDAQQVKQRIGKAIARRRLACDLTQDQVAEHLNIGSEAVSRIERGLVEPSIVRLFELAELFQCATTDLLQESSVRKDDQIEEANKLLSMLSNDDRETVMKMLEVFVATRRR
ncbi:MAG: helix-turn-helix transcriptional regulator [Neisseriaceae bacterium]|nr:helix-turn-helix transcriptional regulator [Neisseriaceae bacterium]